MSNIKFHYLTEEKYDALPEEEKIEEETFFMTKGVDCYSIYNRGRRYASSSDFHLLNSEAELPVIGDPELLYVIKTGDIYVWDDHSLRYVNATGSGYDIIDGGSATSS